jgi:hypothetical protein
MQARNVPGGWRYEGGNNRKALQAAISASEKLLTACMIDGVTIAGLWGAGREKLDSGLSSKIKVESASITTNLKELRTRTGSCYHYVHADRARIPAGVE